MRFWEKFCYIALLFPIVLLVGCCDLNLEKCYHDPLIKKTEKDYKDLLAPINPCAARAYAQKKACAQVIPACCKQKVSLFLSGNIPLSEAFLELSRQVKINIAFDGPMKKTGILYNASNQPFIDVLDNICSLSKLRYYFVHDTLHVCGDGPYMRTHNVQFLLGARKTQTQTTIKTDVLGEGLHPSKNCVPLENGANISMNMQNVADFWQELENNLCLMLACHQKEKGVSCQKGKCSHSSYSLNRYAGILTVYGNEQQQKRVADYLAQLQRMITTQVIIEAKIVEISLSDDYKAGVNWDVLAGQQLHNFKLTLPFGELVDPLQPMGQVNTPTTGAPPIPPEPGAAVAGQTAQIMNKPRDVFSLGINTPNVNAIVTFMERFGTVRTIANPRLTVLNNQAAMLKVAQNEVFFEVLLEDVLASQAGPGIQRVQSRIQTVPIGLILFVQPSVNFETGEIVLSMQPTISRVTQYRRDPTVTARGGPVPNEIPVIQTREMNTVIVARPEQVIVTGGLMEEKNENSTTSVPEISEIPILGQLFKARVKRREVTELVILLKLSFVTDPTLADERVYRCFTQDPRPF